MGRSKKERFYAFVETTDGDLAELLIANGLARVHGRAATPEGLSSPEREWQKLQRLEREAKAQKVGGWGATAGRMRVRLPKQPAKGGADSFTAFFHPEQVATSSEAAEPPTQRTTVNVPAKSALAATPRAALAASDSTKLDVNSATAAELMQIPCVGPVLSQRIMEARPFHSADDLRGLKGIGAQKFEKLRPVFR